MSAEGEFSPGAEHERLYFEAETIIANEAARIDEERADRVMRIAIAGSAADGVVDRKDPPYYALEEAVTAAKQSGALQEAIQEIKDREARQMRKIALGALIGGLAAVLTSGNFASFASGGRSLKRHWI